MPRSRRGRPALDAQDRSVPLTLRMPSKAYDALARRAILARRSVAAQARRELTRTLPARDDDGR